jgi:galactokinase
MRKNELKTLGTLLYESHHGLQTQYKVSCDELDFLVEKAMESAEIIGARMMGGGFGGCTINLIKNNSEEVIETIVKAYQSKFNIKPSVYQVNIEDGVRVL